LPSCSTLQPLQVHCFFLCQVSDDDRTKQISTVHVGQWLIIAPPPSHSLPLSLHFIGHLPDGSGLAGTIISPFWILLELRVMEVVNGDNWSCRMCKAPNCHHQQTVFQITYKWPYLHPLKVPNISNFGTKTYANVQNSQSYILNSSVGRNMLGGSNRTVLEKLAQSGEQ